MDVVNVVSGCFGGNTNIENRVLFLDIARDTVLSSWSDWLADKDET